MKSLKLSFCLTLICLIFGFAGVLCSQFSQVYADSDPLSAYGIQGEGTETSPFLIDTVADLQAMGENATIINNYYGSYYRLSQSIEISAYWTSTIGNITNKFSGTFDGSGYTITYTTTNGRTVNGYSNNGADGITELGLFGYTNGAKIKNLAVSATVRVTDCYDGTNYNAVNKILVGGIVGKAESTKIENCKSQLNLLVTRVAEDTNKYLGSLSVGGIVGEMVASTVKNSYTQVKLNISQEGTSKITSYFGGVAGYAINGEISNCYVAPSGSLFSTLSTKAGVLTSLANTDADIVINSANTNAESNIAVGGIVGYLKGASFKMYNTLYSSIMYITKGTGSNSINFGGVIGKLPINSSEWPSVKLEYAYFLRIQNSTVTDMANAIGNSTAVGFSNYSFFTSISAIPTESNNIFISSNWYEFKAWNYESIWKNSSIPGSTRGYFFPELQCFSSFTISLSPINVLQTNANDSYLSGYFTLNFENDDESIEKDFSAGETVVIIAQFYNGTGVLDFKKYFSFTQWFMGVETTIASAYESSGEVYTTESKAAVEDGQAKITFKASSATEGTYGINIIGNPVEVTVILTRPSDTNYGSIKHIKTNTTTSYSQTFTYNIDNYLSGVVSSLEAVNSINSHFVFYQWKDMNQTTNISNLRNIKFQINNNESSSLNMFYLRAIYEEDDEGNGKLTSKIYCEFSSNTALITINVEGEGAVTIDSEAVTSGTATSVVANKNLTLVATAEEGYVFKGWYDGETLLSSDANYTASITEETDIKAVFQTAESAGGGGLAGWIIAVIVISILAVGGGTAGIIVAVKRKSLTGYKKNYRY